MKNIYLRALWPLPVSKLLSSGDLERCPGCGGLSAYAWMYVRPLQKIAHVRATSCFEWQCGHCGRGWTDEDSPINAEAYTHIPRE